MPRGWTCWGLGVSTQSCNLSEPAEQGSSREEAALWSDWGKVSVNHLSGGSSSGEQTAEAEAGGSSPGDFSCGANTLEAINL